MFVDVFICLNVRSATAFPTAPHSDPRCLRLGAASASSKSLRVDVQADWKNLLRAQDQGSFAISCWSLGDSAVPNAATDISGRDAAVTKTNRQGRVVGCASCPHQNPVDLSWFLLILSFIAFRFSGAAQKGFPKTRPIKGQQAS